MGGRGEGGVSCHININSTDVRYTRGAMKVHNKKMKAALLPLKRAGGFRPRSDSHKCHYGGQREVT